MKRLRWLARDPVWKERAAGSIAAMIRLLDRTCRIEFDAHPDAMAAMQGADGVLAAYWHGRLAFMPLLWWNILRKAGMDPGTPAYSLSSQHRDGALMARALELIGLKIISASNRTGGSKAFREIRRVLKQGGCVPIAVDGGKGPRQRVQGGIVLLAKFSGSPIVPATGSSRWGRQLRGWDRLLIPFPGSKIVGRLGEPIWVPRDAGEEDLRRFEHELEDALNTLMDDADRRCGRDPTPPASPELQVGT